MNRSRSNLLKSKRNSFSFLVPTRILVISIALGVGIKTFAQNHPVPSSPSELNSNLKSSPDLSAKPELKTELPPIATKFETKFEPIGDLRYRISNSKEDIDEARTIHQLRARLGIKAQVEESLALTFRLATATSAIGSNQTLGDSSAPGMPRRSFGLDLAYTDFKIGSDAKLWVGRTANPFWAPAKNQLIYDSDLAFEGLALKYEPKFESWTAFINLGGFMVNESYDKPYDTADLGIAGAQAGVSAAGFTFHVSQQAFVNIQDRPITGIEAGAKTDPFQGTSFNVYRGNTVYPNDPNLPAASRIYYMQNKFVVMNAGLEYKSKLAGIECTAFADAIRNTAADRLNNGSEIGLGFKYERLLLQMAQVTKQADSTVGAFTDSDTNGGGTDVSGTRVILSYQLSPKSQIGINSYQAQRGLDTVRRNFSLTQFDLAATF